MMRVGILTFHNADNLGCVLQCYGLQEAIKELYPNAEVEIINYDEINKPLFQPNEYQLRRADAFRKFRLKYLNIYGERILDFNDLPANRYDICFVGSDQVWNYNLIAGKERAYFLHFTGDNTRRASYAASVGSFEDDEERTDWIRRNIQGMDSISIREESAKFGISQLTENDVSVCLDPTLLHDRVFWESIERKPEGFGKERYVLLYSLGYAWCRDYEQKAAEMTKAIAKNKGLKVVHYYWGKLREWLPDDALDCFCEGPMELLWLFHHAEYVICCSFHGTAFSVIYEKPFYTFFTPGNGNRMRDLVTSLGMADRYISDALSLDKWNWNIEWNDVNIGLEKKKTSSLDFIKNEISKC